jgi:hypothetical protein
MSQPAIASGIKLTSLLDQIYIIHPPACKHEGEEDQKLMFYYPRTDAIDLKLQSIGFCEAAVKFTESFVEGMIIVTSEDYQTHLFHYFHKTLKKKIHFL